MANEITAVSTPPPLITAAGGGSARTASSGGAPAPAPVVIGGASTPPAPAPKAPGATSLEDIVKSSEESVQKALDEIAKHFEGSQANLQFRMDRDAGRMVLSVVDAKDGTVLKQLPSEVALRIARSIDGFREQLHLVQEVA